MPLSANTRASLLMAGSMAGFTINDVLVKSLGETINAGQVMLVRGLIMMVFLVAFVRASRTNMPIRAVRTKPMMIRVAAEALATIFFLTALFKMPIANVSAILQALPLAVTLGAALFLSEPVGIRRISAIGVGFVGVLVIIRPGLEGFNIFALSAMMTVVFAATRDLATRRLPVEVPSVAVSLVTTIAVAACGAVLMEVLGGWTPMDLKTFGVLAIASMFLFVGYQGIVVAMRVGEDIHVVAPFRYTSLLWAITLGALVFGEIPDALTAFGASIIIATGLYTLYRERLVSRRAASANISAASVPPARGT
ncbi:DMT family transporter [Oricola cellulosilytica]|uniref:DMT family transporter n=1 Tax=Oricola cellulosilytica TaxID=1429082 RepID=A0A4R0P791_9HYPH|nr:DMT family transporter [Oricola cellulosilytica]TCD11814.1 DMT family transporter [Oricola cellulosilytica]